ncbi:hypothetical protein HDU97_002315 [Phlyctochytrium planicorne]|nr:hypothetical protein HDU97_002315 [Phlyctochytrium planicorne]
MTASVIKMAVCEATDGLLQYSPLEAALRSVGSLTECITLFSQQGGAGRANGEQSLIEMTFKTPDSPSDKSSLDWFDELLAPQLKKSESLIDLDDSEGIQMPELAVYDPYIAARESAKSLTILTDTANFGISALTKSDPRQKLAHGGSPLKVRQPRKLNERKKQRLNHKETAAIAVAAAAALLAPSADSNACTPHPADAMLSEGSSGFLLRGKPKKFSLKAAKAAQKVSVTVAAAAAAVAASKERERRQSASPNDPANGDFISEFDAPSSDVPSSPSGSTQDTVANRRSSREPFHGLASASSSKNNPFDTSTPSKSRTKRASTPSKPGRVSRKDSSSSILSQGSLETESSLANSENNSLRRTPRKSVPKRRYDDVASDTSPVKQPSVSQQIKKMRLEESQEIITAQKSSKSKSSTPLARKSRDENSSPVTPPPSASKTRAFFRGSSRSQNIVSDEEGDAFIDGMDQDSEDESDRVSKKPSPYSSPVQSPQKDVDMDAVPRRITRQRSSGRIATPTPKKAPKLKAAPPKAQQAPKKIELVSPCLNDDDLDDDDAFYFEDLDPEDIERVSGGGVPQLTSLLADSFNPPIAEDDDEGDQSEYELAEGEEAAMAVSGACNRIGNAVEREAENANDFEDDNPAQRLFYLFKVSGSELAEWKDKA